MDEDVIPIKRAVARRFESVKNEFDTLVAEMDEHGKLVAESCRSMTTHRLARGLLAGPDLPFVFAHSAENQEQRYCEYQLCGIPEHFEILKYTMIPIALKKEKSSG